MRISAYSRPGKQQARAVGSLKARAAAVQTAAALFHCAASCVNSGGRMSLSGGSETYTVPVQPCDTVRLALRYRMGGTS